MFEVLDDGAEGVLDSTRAEILLFQMVQDVVDVDLVRRPRVDKLGHEPWFRCSEAENSHRQLHLLDHGRSFPTFGHLQRHEPEALEMFRFGALLVGGHKPFRPALIAENALLKL